MDVVEMEEKYDFDEEEEVVKEVDDEGSDAGADGVSGEDHRFADL